MTTAAYPNPSKTVSGNVTTYVITDTIQNTLTLAVTEASNAAASVAFSGGPMLPDGMKIFAQLALMLSTGQLP